MCCICFVYHHNYDMYKNIIPLWIHLNCSKVSEKTAVEFGTNRRTVKQEVNLVFVRKRI